LGKYPFMTCVNRFLKKRRGIISQSTYEEEEERKLRYLGSEKRNRKGEKGVFPMLKNKGLVTTTNPIKMRYEDIQGFLDG